MVRSTLNSWDYSFALEFAGIKNGSMIVSRMQDHSVETADGALHMMVNLGLGKGLTLLTSVDGGETWNESISLTDSGPFSSSDIQLSDDGSTLMVTYLGANNVVTFISYSWDDSANNWIEINSTELSTESFNPFTVLPTLDIGPTGRIWSSYASPESEGLKLTVQFSDDGGGTWSILETVVPTGDSGVAKVIVSGSTVGVVVATENSLSWLTYQNGQWITEVISLDGTAGAFSSHFSSVVVGNDIYLCNITPTGEAQLFVNRAQDGEWISVNVPELTDLSVTTTQVSLSDEGVLYVIVDDPENGSLKILASSDGGDSWGSQSVPFPAYLAGYPLRFETPEYFNGDLVISVQVGLGGASGVSWLIEIRVDVNGNFVVVDLGDESLQAGMGLASLIEFKDLINSVELSETLNLVDAPTANSVLNTVESMNNSLQDHESSTDVEIIQLQESDCFQFLL
jgi:hypothetical protein